MRVERSAWNVRRNHPSTGGFGRNLKMAHALIVDDSASTLESLEQLVRLEGFSTATAATIDQARAQLSKQPPDVVPVDLNLPDGSGLNLFDSINGLSEAPPAVVLITGQASLDSAVEALRRGVSDYLTKPLYVERLRKILQDISQTKRLPDELRELRSEQQRTGRFVGIVGRSEPIVRACELISRIAPSSASVLVTGESGSGKDVVARAIHELSRRRHGPWVPVNCGAISPSLMESELFGHERGSFTGAERRHKGYFEQATRGTLFLDEITEMPIELQIKLLRVLETNSLARVGGEQPIQVDVRILAASNRNVQQAIDEGKLRPDLYYRLKVFQIDLAPLRSRREDIPLLAQAFLEDLMQTEGRPKRFTEQALEILGQYNWPGNVRELKNVVHFAYVLSEDLIDADSLPTEVKRGGRPAEPATETKTDTGGVLTVRVGSTIAEVERRLILATLREYQDDKPKSASVLGISLKTLYNRLNHYQTPDPGQATPEEQPPPSTPTTPVEVA
jgi:DNA-binding NtrC family response regulator